MKKSGIILLSGGLDSLVSLDIAFKKIKNIKALFFDYGQKALDEEYTAVKNIAKYYNISVEKIKLPFLKELSNNALTNPLNNNFEDINSVWIPNRNGLFINIAASYCDKLKYDYIIIGANKEEATKFSDNTQNFIKFSNKFLKYSTLNHPKVIAPCHDFDKIDIINYAIDNNLPLKLIKSCYNSIKNTKKRHCGKCMSCKFLYNAILKSSNPNLVKEIF